jgi:N-acetylmuramoyl-L-alanine amidase
MPTVSESPAPKRAPIQRGGLHAVKRIVLDPGHGGKDPGTVGGRGTEEKTLNLAFAMTLADILRAQYGYEVLLTRTDDTFIPLGQRPRIANKWNADLFISLHCNASLSAQLHGFEVYFLSEKASDAHADAVARTENAPLALEEGGGQVPSQLQALLRSLVKNANINDASLLGSLVDRQVNKDLKTKSRGVQQAAFYVLRGAEMPAVLVETGFLSNTKEEKLLQNPNFRRQIMEGVANAVATYDIRKQRERR